MATINTAVKAVKPKPVSTVRTLFGTPVPEGNMLPDDHYKLGTTPMVGPDDIVGLELEIESFPRGDAIDGFYFENDGSLRNNGREAISLPTKTKFLETLLTQFFKKYKITKENYSDRCSVHVHMNAQDMTLDQVKSMALVYQTVERLLFQYIGHERDENLYCVPWYTAGITANFVSKLKAAKTTIAQWVKYTALNLEPLVRYGTMEFRHMHGNCDVEFIIKWVNLIISMRKYAMSRPLTEVVKTIMEMNTVSNYDAFLHDVFKDHTATLMKGNYKQLLEVGVVDSKIMLADKAAAKEEDFLVAINPIPAPPRFARNLARPVPQDELHRLREQENIMRRQLGLPPNPNPVEQQFVWNPLRGVVERADVAAQAAQQQAIVDELAHDEFERELARQEDEERF